ncbi:MAG: DUF4445 domain-containing protein [Clostridia bacterium]|nr:DUF4445 domain-containing protein [Clostridia bacterium]
MHKVTIGEKEFFAKDGQLLSQLLGEQEIFVDHPCGGRGVCKKCTVLVNGKEELACRYEIRSDITVTPPEAADILSEHGARIDGEGQDGVSLALDIGTTSLALALISKDGEIIKVLTRKNPQTAFGADVMSRISYAKENSVAPMQAVLIKTVNAMISEITSKKIERMFVSGNATMLHIFLGVDCTSMGAAPYTPAFLDEREASAEELGLLGIQRVITLPSVSAFVGADLVAGMNFVKMPRGERHSLLVDLGTNAEIILYSKDGAICTAAAAGPCFEGANISHGMPAMPGAVSAFCFDESGKAVISTIGNAEPCGICGTGLIDIISELVRCESIDETGFMEDDFEVADGVILTPSDVRQYQLAKSAVCSAILSLMYTRGVGFDDIDTVYITGGFSTKLNAESAVSTGLLPRELKSKFLPLGNSSLLGTVKYASEGGDLSRLTATCEYIDLSASEYFSRLFMENMYFSE